jgi:hypothetical protein
MIGVGLRGRIGERGRKLTGLDRFRRKQLDPSKEGDRFDSGAAVVPMVHSLSRESRRLSDERGKSRNKKHKKRGLRILAL